MSCKLVPLGQESNANGSQVDRPAHSRTDQSQIFSMSRVVHIHNVVHLPFIFYTTYQNSTYIYIYIYISSLYYIHPIISRHNFEYHILHNVNRYINDSDNNIITKHVPTIYSLSRSYTYLYICIYVHVYIILFISNEVEFNDKDILNCLSAIHYWCYK